VIEALVVDLGGVAAHFRPERRLAALATLSGLTERVIQERVFDSGFEHRAELGEYPPEQVREFVREALEHRLSTPALTDAWALAFEPETEVLAYLSALPIRRALFTNNGPMLDACLAGPLGEIAKPFAEVICSWQLRARKPGPVAFARAEERLRLAPDRLLLLDDSPENVRAAQHAGWAAECVCDLKSVVAATRRYLDP
jgi:glucose-1-phosphatase